MYFVFRNIEAMATLRTHARHITAVAPETLRTMIVARAQHELSIGDRENEG